MTVDLDNIDFEQLIGDRDIEIYKLIEAINEQGIAWALCRYARYVVKGRWPEAEPYIMKNPKTAYRYALCVIKGRWLEAEPYIKKNPEQACHYAYYILEGRWPEAESYMQKNPFFTYLYSCRFKVRL